jgi:hypothetical protein
LNYSSAIVIIYSHQIKKKKSRIFGRQGRSLEDLGTLHLMDKKGKHFRRWKVTEVTETEVIETLERKTTKGINSLL